MRSTFHRLDSLLLCALTLRLSAWDDGEADRHIAWASACWRAMAPFAGSGVYVNFLGNEGEGRVRVAYGVNYERLASLKNRYKPSKFFHLIQNSKPTMSSIRAGSEWHSPQQPLAENDDIGAFLAQNKRKQLKQNNGDWRKRWPMLNGS